MGEIIATKSGIDEIIDMLESEKKNISGYIESIDSELGKVNEAWEGSNSTLFTKKMRDDYSVLLNALNESLDSYISYLKGVYKEYDTLDKEFASRSIEV